MAKDGEERPRTRRSLLSRLGKSDDVVSWEEFVATYRKGIYQQARQANLTHEEAEDVTQDTLLTLWKKIRSGDFKYQPETGKFRGYLAQTTHWRIEDYRRKKQRQPQPLNRPPRRTTLSTGTVDRMPDENTPGQDSIVSAEWSKALWDAALEKIKIQVKPKQFQLFEHYVIKEWPTQKVVDAFGVSRAQVFLAKLRISRLIREEVSKLQKIGL